MHESDTSTRRAPDDIVDLARRRADARRERNWTAADDLRAQIESAGWKVVDDGTRFRLEPAHPPDLVVDGRTRYGSSTSVPSRLADPPTSAASVVLLADRWPDDLARTLDGLERHAPAGTQVVIVANAPTPEQADALARLDQTTGAPATAAGDPTNPALSSIAPGDPPVAPLSVEVVWTSAPLGRAMALNVAVRRASGAVVVLLDTSVEPLGDFVTPLVAALDDPSVAVAGPWGLDSPDLHHYEEASGPEMTAICGDCMAFRRADFAARGPFDERYRTAAHLDAWWSLVLRDEGADREPRRALALESVPLDRHRHRDGLPLPEEERERLARRNLYRLTDRFGHRHDLLPHPAPGSWKNQGDQRKPRGGRTANPT